MNSPKTPIIKKAELTDVQELVQFHLACWNDSYKGLLESDLLKNLNKIITVDRYNSLLSKKHNIYILCLEHKIIGLISFGNVRDKLEISVKAFEIYAIYIKKSFWNMGFGQQLLNFAEQQITNYYKIKTIIIWTLENNLRSHYFYNKNDYQQTQCRKEFILFEYKHPEIMFIKKMTPPKR